MKEQLTNEEIRDFCLRMPMFLNGGIDMTEGLALLAEEEAEALDKAIFEDGYEEEVDKAVASATGSLKSVKSGPAKNGNQKSTNVRNTKQTSGKANNGKILNARTSNVRPDMERTKKTRNER